MGKNISRKSGAEKNMASLKELNFQYLSRDGKMLLRIVSREETELPSAVLSRTFVSYSAQLGRQRANVRHLKTEVASWSLP